MKWEIQPHIFVSYSFHLSLTHLLFSHHHFFLFVPLSVLRKTRLETFGSLWTILISKLHLGFSSDESSSKRRRLSFFRSRLREATDLDLIRRRNLFWRRRRRRSSLTSPFFFSFHLVDFDQKVFWMEASGRVEQDQKKIKKTTKLHFLLFHECSADTQLGPNAVTALIL